MGQNKAGSSLPEQKVVEIATKNTQDSLVIPKGATKVTIQESNGNNIRYAFVDGRVAGNTEPHWKLKSGQARNIETLYLQGRSDAARTIYFASPVDNARIQVEIWK